MSLVTQIEAMKKQGEPQKIKNSKQALQSAIHQAELEPRPGQPNILEFFTRKRLDNSYVESKYSKVAPRLSPHCFCKKEPEYLSLETLYAVIIANMDLSL